MGNKKNQKGKSITVNVALNCLRTVLKMLFPLITYPYISRVLGVTNLGKINFASSIVSYFTIIASLGITNYAIREGSRYKNDEELRNKVFNQLFSVNFIMMVISYILLAVVLIFFDSLTSYVPLILIQSSILFFNWIGIEWIYNIFEDYVYITIRVILVYIISMILLFSFVHEPKDYLIYACINVIATGGFNIFNYVHSKKYFRPKIIKDNKFSSHIRAMLVLAVNLIAVTIYVNSDATIIGFLLGDNQVGLYSVAVKVYSIIKEMLLVIIVTVFPRASYYYYNEKEKYNDLIKTITGVLVLLCIPACVGLFSLRKEIIYILFGSEYSVSGDVLGILAISIIFSVIGTAYATLVLMVTKKEKTIAIITIISALINIGTNFIMIPLIGIGGAAITTAFSEGFSMFAFVAISKEYNKYIIGGSGIRAFIGSGIIFIVCMLIKNISNNNLIIIIISVIASGLSYFLLLVITREPLVKRWLTMLINKLKRA